jgi:DNA-binding transcriptional LysR family regulator
MLRKIDWENQIGRRLRLHDLHVFFTVVQRGSMAKAAAHLGVSQPAVSEVIAGLEHALGVRLLDRSPQGVQPTMYGRALLKGGTAAFDDLRQSIREIEFLADPTAGELRIGCAETTASAVLPPLIQRFLQEYPRVALHVNNVVATSQQWRELRERTLDLILTRYVGFTEGEEDDLDIQTLFDDHMVIAAGRHSRWAHRAKIDLAELVDEPWILTPPQSYNSVILAEHFRARGLAMPKASLTTFSVHLRANLLASGPFIAAFPGSVLRLNADRFSLKALPVDLPQRPWPLCAVTLKNRTLSPVTQRFIDHVRAYTMSTANETAPAQKSASMR